MEPSTLYQKGAGYYYRVYVNFKVTYSGSKLKAADLIFGDTALVGLKKDTWFNGIYDIKIGTINGSSDGSDYYITSDSLIDWDK